MYNGMSLTGAGMMGANPSPAPFLTDLMGFLLDNTGITVKLGHIPQGKDTLYPAVMLTQTGGGPSLSLSSVVTMISAELQFDIYSPDYIDVLATSDQLKQVLQGFRGFMAATRVSDCTVTNSRAWWESLRAGDDVGLNRALLEVTIWYYSGDTPP